jgi:hypothetical protein
MVPVHHGSVIFTHLGETTSVEEERQKRPRQQENEMEEDPLVEAVERAVEEALEMLLRDDDNHDHDNDQDDLGNASDQDSITTACRAAAEQSLRDELALADGDFLLASWCRYKHHARLLFRENEDEDDDGIVRRSEDNHHLDQGWWLELKEDRSVAGTSITATSSWSSPSHSRGGRGDRSTASAPDEHFDDTLFGHHDCLPPERYWEHLLVGIAQHDANHADVDNDPEQQQHQQQQPARIDLVVACNLLAVALEARKAQRRWRSPPALLWRGWKQQLDESLNADMWARLVGDHDENSSNGSDDAYRHVVLLAVPLLGGTRTLVLPSLSKQRMRRCWEFGFLTDTWSRYLTNRHVDYHQMQEID